MLKTNDTWLAKVATGHSMEHAQPILFIAYAAELFTT